MENLWKQRSTLSKKREQHTSKGIGFLHHEFFSLSIPCRIKGIKMHRFCFRFFVVGWLESNNIVRIRLNLNTIVKRCLMRVSVWTFGRSNTNIQQQRIFWCLFSVFHQLSWMPYAWSGSFLFSFSLWVDFVEFFFRRMYCWRLFFRRDWLQRIFLLYLRYNSTCDLTFVISFTIL